MIQTDSNPEALPQTSLDTEIKRTRLGRWTRSIIGGAGITGGLTLLTVPTYEAIINFPTATPMPHLADVLPKAIYSVGPRIIEILNGSQIAPHELAVAVTLGLGLYTIPYLAFFLNEAQVDKIRGRYENSET